MNLHLTYTSGQSYSEYFSNFRVTVSRKNVKRVHVSFREKENENDPQSLTLKPKTYASFSLPIDKAQQLAYAILTATAAGDTSPIEFAVNEAVRSQTVAA